ncbi:PEP-CTERM/exosortase system-associated acyltransferase [Halomonas sp. M1]|uniref:PEP-CTERM/exosortase system-associated acyltransferase n=1 Tax=Halomonas sp. M1 TaxID=3035470 RepID=UPI002486CC69|nr:PEP-CTERM/exosortase system-associated acyltransferase [Halomonas sp. M1]WFE71273.1 PEP-CTERM/exosortase system-associated acyltransferase [Halomonas sp. M1]
MKKIAINKTIHPPTTTPEDIKQNTFTPDFFDRHFSLIIAQTTDEKIRAFSLRHAVFNEELNYKLGDTPHQNIEKDIHDQHSILCLLHHKETGIDVGCVRVVLINKQRFSSSPSLPLEEYYHKSLFTSHQHPRYFASESVCEVSRLAVHPGFRRKSAADINNHESSIRESPALVSLSLFLAATAIVGIAQRHHVFAMLEPRFNRLLGASGLHFQQVGELIQHCGERAAFYIDQRVAEHHLPEKIVPLYQLIKSGLATQLAYANTPAFSDATPL